MKWLAAIFLRRVAVNVVTPAHTLGYGADTLGYGPDEIGYN